MVFQDSFILTLALTYVCATIALASGASQRRRVVASCTYLGYTIWILCSLRNSSLAIFDRLFLAMQAQGLLLLINLVLNMTITPGLADCRHFTARLLAAAQLVFNPRGISCSWGIRYKTPPRVRWLSSRACFVFLRLSQCAIFVTLSSLHERHIPEAAISPEVQNSLHSITNIDHLKSRLLMTYQHFSHQYFAWSGHHCLASVVAVAVCGADPQDWPPLFGSIVDAYSLKRFWTYVPSHSQTMWRSTCSLSCSIFWHALFRPVLSMHSRWITKDILRLEGSLALLVHPLLAFTISGVMHALAMDSLCSMRVGLLVYLAQGVGVVVETLLLYGMRKAAHERREQPPVLSRLLGYIWVVLFLTTTFSSAAIAGRSCKKGQADPWRLDAIT
jgi:hypothetical protein